MRMAGIGFRGAASVASLRDALARANPDGLKIDALVTEAAKARATVFRDFAQELGVPGLGITTEDLARMITPTQSARIEDRFGTGSLGSRRIGRRRTGSRIGCRARRFRRCHGHSGDCRDERKTP